MDISVSPSALLAAARSLTEAADAVAESAARHGDPSPSTPIEQPAQAPENVDAVEADEAEVAWESMTQACAEHQDAFAKAMEIVQRTVRTTADALEGTARDYQECEAAAVEMITKTLGTR